MMRGFFSLLLFCSFLKGAFAFDATCFREEANMTPPYHSGMIAVMIPWTWEDVFFLQDKKVLSSWESTNIKNSPIPYTVSPSLDTGILMDDDPMSAITVDPYELAKGDVSFTFDLGKVYTRDTLNTKITYRTDTVVRFSISKDGTLFIPVVEETLRNFDFQYIRMTFEKPNTLKNISLVDTVQFFENRKIRLLVEPLSSSSISAYRGFGCESIELEKLKKERGGGGENRINIPEVEIIFSPNPLYKNDSDNDSIENSRDNCPHTPNLDQKDRNHDGVGDACSDDDGDGLFGADDNCPTVLNKDQKDINVNDVGDACEFDTDNDGIADGEDTCIRIANPDQSDRDGDGIGDACDNCTLYNPDQLDLDKNMRGDVCDRQKEYEASHDEDKDGILDMLDNCKKVRNPDQNDRDRDGVGDACDNCPQIQNSDQKDENKNNIGDACEDTDGDTILGWRDNCPTVANPDQSDRNNDGVGDACEDTDDDTIFDSRDNCPLKYNPDQKDLDADSIGNPCDPKDDRFLESNRTLFMILFGCIVFGFIALIIFFMRKVSLRQG